MNIELIIDKYLIFIDKYKYYKYIKKDIKNLNLTIKKAIINYID